MVNYLWRHLSAHSVIGSTTLRVPPNHHCSSVSAALSHPVPFNEVSQSGFLLVQVIPFHVNPSFTLEPIFTRLSSLFLILLQHKIYIDRWYNFEYLNKISVTNLVAL